MGAFAITILNFITMGTSALRAYVLAHQEDKAAFQTISDRFKAIEDSLLLAIRSDD
jgi:hypothetical protein